MITITDGQTDIILDDITEDAFWNDKHYKSLKENLETFDFTTFADKTFSEHLAKKNRVIIPGEDGEFIEFIIQNTSKYRDTNGGLFMDVYTSASYIELRTVKVIRPQTLQGATAKSAAEFAVAGTEWQVGQVDYAGIRTIPIENHTNPYSLLKQIASEFGLELRFHIEHDGNQITGRYVDLIERVGDWKGREVEFGKDLLGIERKEDTSNVVTALIGLGPEQEDGNRLEVFVEDKEALARWGRNGQHIIDVYEPQSADTEMTEERLRELTKNELEKRINSIVEYTADISDLEKVLGLEHEKIRFGDTLRIKDTQFNPPLYIEARVHTQERSIKKNGYKTVTLGDYIEYTEEEVMAIWKSLKAEIAKKVSMSDVMEVTYTKTEIDDKDAGVYQDSTYYADNVSETKKQEAIQVAATDATNKANLAEQNAKNHADTVAEQKKQEAIQQAVADAETKINTAKTELEADIALKADAEWVNGQLVLKENVITKSNTAPSNPTTGQLWLDTSVTPNVLKRWDGSVWVKATPTSAGEVGAYTKTEVDNALNSKVSITQYTTDMNGVITRLDSAESRITQTENEIATKVSLTQYQQDQDDLSSQLSQMSTQIQETAEQIALKAEQTTVDTLENRISSAESSITLLSDEIQLKVDKDGVISAINVSPEGVRIDGAKVHITGQTTIDNGVIKTAAIADAAITNAKIANLAIDDAKIANLSASKLTAGTINVNDVSISNDKVTIDSTGVVANDSTFRLKDSVTQTESIVRENSNMLSDHSFEMIPCTGSADVNQTFLVDRSRLGNYFWWDVRGSGASTARVLSTYGTGFNQTARFGKQAIVCADVSNYYWIQFVEVSRHSTSTYTLSAYFAAYGGTTKNCQGQLVIQAFDENFAWIADVASGTVDIIASEKFRWKRCVCTTTSLPSGTAYLRVRINAIGSFVLCDGVQLVPFAYPTVYEAEEGLWKLMNGLAGYEANLLVSKYIYASNGLYSGLEIEFGSGRLVNSNNESYIQGNTSVRATKYKSTQLVPMYAASFNTSSSVDNKTNIEKWEESALEILRNEAELYSYNKIDELNDGINRKRHGFVIGGEYKVPAQLLSLDGKAIDGYEHSVLNTKAIMELDDEQQLIKDDVEWLKTENQYLKQKIQQLEAKIT